MNRYIILILLTILTTSLSGQTNNNLIGEYHSVNNRFEGFSNLILLDGSRFVYEYAFGGCQGNITGYWKIDGKYLKLECDKEFNNNSTTSEKITIGNDSLIMTIPKPFYPDLNNIKWKIGNNWVKPVNAIDSGCMIEKGKHKR